MSTLSTEAYPYPLTAVCELLKMEEARIVALCNALDIKPHKDNRSGKLFLNAQSVELLQRSVQGQSKNEPVKTASESVVQVQPSNVVKQSASPVTPPAKTSQLSRADLSLVVESVSSAKEEILKDLSQLLDDKLAGLDDVVVELIRSKSEVDSLREELKRIEASRDQMQRELSKFRPAAFGFYRKEH